MASVPLRDIGFHFAWQALHLMTLTLTLRGTRGTYETRLALVARLFPGDTVPLCMAGLAQQKQPVRQEGHL